MTDLDLDATTQPIAGDDTVLDLKRAITRCPECSQHFGPDARFCPFDGTELASEEWDPGNDSLLGAIVDDRYEVCAVLGEGGMGTVYKVRHTSLDRMFAMKVLRKDLARDRDLAARFTQEARATARIRHPNVVQITDFGRLGDDVPYFVMELLVGLPLSSALKAQGLLPIGVASDLVLKMAAALGAAHDAGIVHRDMKPENVFLVGHATPPGVPRDVRIVDFGAAKVMGASRLTKTGIVFGTPHFMSPEQGSGGEVDHRTDIYALGVIMFEIFTGRVPFEADTYMGVLTQHMFVAPPRPSDISPHAKALGALEGVILRALEKKPEARFGSMEELTAEIRRVVRVAPTGEAEVAPATSPPPPRRFEYPGVGPPAPPSYAPPRRGPGPWLLGVSGTLLVASLSMWVIVYRSPTQPTNAVPPNAILTPTPSLTPIPTATPPPTPIPTLAPSPSVENSARKRPIPVPIPRASPPRGSPEFVDPWKKDRP
jgi:serine/threonine-protein kinase